MGNRIDLRSVLQLTTHFSIDQRSIGEYLDSTTRVTGPEVTNDPGTAMHCAQETSRHMSEKTIPKSDVYRFRNPVSTTSPHTSSESSLEFDQDHDAMRHCHPVSTTTVAERGRSDSSVIDIVRNFDSRSKAHDQKPTYYRKQSKLSIGELRFLATALTPPWQPRTPSFLNLLKSSTQYLQPQLLNNRTLETVTP